MSKIKVDRVEQQVIRKSHPMWKIIDENCFYSKNLYNYANYLMREKFFKTGNVFTYKELDKMLQQHKLYKQLKSQPSQCTLQMLDRSWKSYFEGIEEYKLNPDKFLGEPKIPKYLDKNGRYPWFIKNNCCSINEDGTINFIVKRLKGFTFKTNVKNRLICIRFIPKGTCYIMEIVYEIEVKTKKEINEKQIERICSIDLGVNNFVTLTNNIGLNPIIINGKGIKSINQFYNKQKAKFQSDVMKRNGKYWSKKLNAITFKRYNRVKNYIHHVSRYIVDYCIENKIDTLIVGKNKQWKQNKNHKQNFVYLPYNILTGQLEYKCQNIGIRIIIREESYTSGTSFLDCEIPCKENYDNSRRIHRGLFQANRTLINADVNASLQIMRKAFPNVEFNYGIEGVLNPTIISVIEF